MPALVRIQATLATGYLYWCALLQLHGETRRGPWTLGPIDLSRYDQSNLLLHVFELADEVFALTDTLVWLRPLLFFVGPLFFFLFGSMLNRLLMYGIYWIIKPEQVAYAIALLRTYLWPPEPESPPASATFPSERRRGRRRSSPPLLSPGPTVPRERGRGELREELLAKLCSTTPSRSTARSLGVPISHRGLVFSLALPSPLLPPPPSPPLPSQYDTWRTSWARSGRTNAAPRPWPPSSTRASTSTSSSSSWICSFCTWCRRSWPTCRRTRVMLPGVVVVVGVALGAGVWVPVLGMGSPSRPCGEVRREGASPSTARLPLCL